MLDKTLIFSIYATVELPVGRFKRVHPSEILASCSNLQHQAPNKIQLHLPQLECSETHTSYASPLQKHDAYAKYLNKPHLNQNQNEPEIKGYKLRQKYWLTSLWLSFGGSFVLTLQLLVSFSSQATNPIQPGTVHSF